MTKRYHDDTAPQEPVAEAFNVGGKTVYVEVIEPDVHGNGTIERYAGDGVATDMRDAIENALPVADVLMERLSSMAKAPDDIEVTFGVKLSGKVGALIASTSVDGNFQVKLKWSGS